MPSRVDPEERFITDTYGSVKEYMRDARRTVVLERGGVTAKYTKMTPAECWRLIEQETKDGWTVVKLTWE